MTDFESIPEPPQYAPAPEPERKETSASRDAWDEVVRSLEHLGSAVSAWAKSATDTEQNRRRAEQLKERLDSAGSQVSGVIDDAAQSDFGQHVGKAAAGTGEVIVDAARKFGEDVLPHLGSAFTSAAEGVMSVGRKKTEPGEPGAASPEASEGPGPHPSPQAAPYEPGEEPPAPAPSGTPAE